MAGKVQISKLGSPFKLHQVLTGKNTSICPFTLKIPITHLAVQNKIKNPLKAY